ncbi:uncharacterized protein LOC116344103 isoform X2 [Contarinia nasturtii]|uniref:uncharacterized protein LOC116344103 isoform X2 n=1 Tax=Contarinia nasturtii TaxID=265458 RepID=UPI0012D423DD|nr:uncharacterized protein LOC116344103 isoform X2 [Contarinia nasturtii]
MAAAKRVVSHFFGKFAISILLIGVVKPSVLNKFVNPLTEPCYGAGNQRVRAITTNSFLADCRQYVQCINDISDQTFTCPPERPYFDANYGKCVHNKNVCFRCPHEEYSLISVPYVHQQFILCFKGKPLLSACEGKLLFDGSAGIHQCNYEWAPEYEEDFENKLCPHVDDEPIYEATDDSTVYYVCYGQQRPVRMKCPERLIFNKYKGICEKVENVK